MRYNRKRTIAALAGILVAAIGLSLWFAPGIIAQKRENDSIREKLPDLPDTNGWPEAFGQALREAKAAVTWRKRKVEGLSELAMLFHANAFLQQAETCYAILSAGDPREARWAYYRSDILLKRGDLTSAENLLEKVVSLKPSYLPAQLKLGDILFKLGKPESAQEVYLRCLQMEAENPYALLGQAREEMRQGKDQETLARLLRLVEKNPEFAAAHMLMAQLLERKGEKRKARLARAQGAASWTLPRSPRSLDGRGGDSLLRSVWSDRAGGHKRRHPPIRESPRYSGSRRKNLPRVRQGAPHPGLCVFRDGAQKGLHSIV